MKAAYARISDDADASGLGVGRQLRDCRGLAELRGWEVREYVDNDLSAFKRGVKRPQFETMLRDLANGVVDGVVVYNLDRLARQPVDLERVIEVYETNPGLTFATLEGDINLASDDGLTMARVMVAFANKASLDTGRRTRRKHRELAEAGQPVGRRTFGWQSDLRTLDPAEAPLARQAVTEVLDGIPLAHVVRRWNDAGVTTTTGNRWSSQTLRKYLQNPRLVGLRTHRGEVLLTPTGEPVHGAWEPLIDGETWERLCLHFEARKLSEPSGARRGARKYLLTGLVRCGVCHGLMFGSKAREDGRFNYVCDRTAQDGHRVAISGHPTDRAALNLTFRRLTLQTEISGPEPWDGEDALREVNEQIAELMRAYDEHELPGRLVFPRVAALEALREKAARDREAWLVATTGPRLAPVSADEWAKLDQVELRARLDATWQAIYVRPVTQRTGRFDPERLDFVERETLTSGAAPQG
ncbi:recombinase family protein [Nocardioides sp. SYSU D00038]|uniref:recombinase family protein n=1 Tax=Nocardioides sp. SYSU D00038 TaxID=2812554 RepID=UPI001967E21E|nr:recombinase family protein [Nocardioides sp. SYSU D00038]